MPEIFKRHLAQNPEFTPDSKQGNQLASLFTRLCRFRLRLFFVHKLMSFSNIDHNQYYFVIINK